MVIIGIICFFTFVIPVIPETLKAIGRPIADWIMKVMDDYDNGINKK